MAVFFVLALIVSYTTVRELRIRGEAMAYQSMALVCPYEGTNVAHVHDESCYDAEGNLRCPLEERELHLHTDACYEEEETLICTLEESEGHVHDASCYTRVWSDEPSCGLDDDPDHVHSRACYDYTDELTCGLEEGDGAHTHTSACYETDWVLACGKKECTEIHQHGDACFQKTELTPEQLAALIAARDAQTEDGWKAAVEALELSGEWAADVLTVAESQLGYGQEGAETSRYTDWYGEPAENDISFIAFCLNFAGVPSKAVPRDNELDRWLSVVGAQPFEEPEPGDIVLFGELNENNETVYKRAAFIKEYSRDENGEIILKVIEFLGEHVVESQYVEGDALGIVRVPDEAEWKKEQRNHLTPAQVFTGEVGSIRITVEADAGAFPTGTEMVVSLVDGDELVEAAAEALAARVSGVEAVDITFINANGEEIEPLIPICVTLSAPRIAHADAAQVVHFADEGAEVVEQKVPAQLDTPLKNDEVAFDSDRFSIYAVVYVIERYVVDSEGDTWRIAVEYGDDAGLPEGVTLEAEELSDQMFLYYDDYAALAKSAAGMEASAARVRLFDIKLVKDGQKLSLAAPVEVTVELADGVGRTGAQVVHFADGAVQGDVVSCTTEAADEGRVVRFEAEGFSVYAIVDAPAPVVVQVQKVTANTEPVDSVPFYISYKGLNTYVTSQLNSNNAFVETASVDDAAEWYFEPAGSTAAYYIYTLVDGRKQYIYNQSGNLVSLSASNKTAFELSDPSTSNGQFYLKKVGENKWLQHSNSGGGIRLYTDNKNSTNSLFTISYVSSYTMPDDPYELNGRSFGIAYNNGSSVAVALTAQPTTVNVKVKDDQGVEQTVPQNRLEADELLIRPDVLDHDGILLVHEGFFDENDNYVEGENLVDWIFEWGGTGADYYIYCTDGGGIRHYLKYEDGGLALVGRDEASVISVTPGTGSNAGKWHFTCNGYSLQLNGSTFKTATGSGAATWMSLLEKSTDLDDRDFTYYTARKVSVSDEENVYDKVVDGQRQQSQIIIYTRVWNDSTKRYEFYAVDHDGVLIPCRDNGDTIEWIGSDINTALWEFTEYHNADGTPNYYYELENVQYRNTFIAPQLEGNQVIANGKIGVNLFGRREGTSTTEIIAWDSAAYSYTGLKVENGRVVPCPLAEAEDFYFAVMRYVDESIEGPSTVHTVDNDRYGITMKMYNFTASDNDDKLARDPTQRAFFGATTNSSDNGDNNVAGLLSTNLNDEGYPVTTDKTNTAGRAFNELYSGNGVEGPYEVNHLFIDSIHNESGYFEYDSTQNHAQLDLTTHEFTVYDQLMAIGDQSGPTRTHGQFLPYSDINGASFASFTNQTDVTAATLPDTDPRKGEPLYWVPGDNENYFFGMEVEASFTQTANGLDAWGHDIIFEFSGDDDFWLYVDGELVLDLGGVHPAMTGSVNFRTGEVHGRDGITTLYNVFKANYEARNAELPEEERLTSAQIEAQLDEIFTTNAVGQRVFKDFTNHTMKVFYMERGAGASNLHMRFNLAAVRPGTFLLSKTVSGTTNSDNSLLEFYYQIFYRLENDPQTIPVDPDDPHGEQIPFWRTLTPTIEKPKPVLFDGTTTAVPFKEEFLPKGSTSDPYESVFVLKPGRTAEVELPEGAKEYKVVECGVNPELYDWVKVNNELITGVDTEHIVQDSTTARQDFATSVASINERQKVDYNNHVRPEAVRSLTITKQLYDSDGVTLLTAEEDSTPFDIRFYLGNENTETGEIIGANVYPYCIKNENHCYCRWDIPLQSFVPLDGVTASTTYEELLQKFEDEHWTAAQIDKVVFKTSMNGSISRIPAGYTVEVHDLLVGTSYKIEERDYEIPRGYTLRLIDGYARTDVDPAVEQSMPYVNTIGADEDPALEIRNQRGWGLTIEKTWTDEDFVPFHDAIYFAVYVLNETGTQQTLVPGTLRQLASGENELYYFFDDLEASIPFARYTVREVMLTPSPATLAPTLNDKGYVTNWEDYAIDPVEQYETLTVFSGEDSEHTSATEYTATYQTGQITGYNANVRVDKVTNSHPGIEIYKTDWASDGQVGSPLAGAVFTLTDSDGNHVRASSFISDADGKITIAYLNEGVYTLTEIGTPQGYYAAKPLTITIGDNYSLTGVISDDTTEFVVTQYTEANSMMLARITVKDRPGSFQVKKVDPDKGSDPAPLAGVHFALYPQQTDSHGNKVKGNTPLTGYEDLVTDENGILPGVNGTLAAGVYYLDETQALLGYSEVDDICFRIDDTGKVTLEGDANPEGVDIVTLLTDTATGDVSCTMLIPNLVQQHVVLKKVPVGFDAATTQGLPGASFAVYAADDFNAAHNRPKTVNGTPAEPILTGTTNEHGMLDLDMLRAGDYYLVETAPPTGFNLYAGQLTISVRETEVTATQGGQPAEVVKQSDTYTVFYWNSIGVELPASGGPGIFVPMAVGFAMTFGAGGCLLLKKKR